MILKILTSGRWAQEKPNMPQIRVIKDEYREDLSKHLCDELIKAGHAEEVKKVPAGKEVVAAD